MSFEDQNVQNVLKEYYDNQKVVNSMFRNSPVLAKIEKKRVGGKFYPVPSMIGASGATCGNFIKFKERVGNWGTTEKMVVTYGQMFAGFTCSTKELEASKGDPAAFVSLLTGKAFSSLEAARKLLALCLYGDGKGTIGSNAVEMKTGDAKITVYNYSAMAIDIGTTLEIYDDKEQKISLDPVIKNIEVGDDLTILTLDQVLPTITTIAKDKGIIRIANCTKNGEPALPVGLAAWLPTVADRTGKDWTDYIEKDFFGVKRSKYVTRLAGSFVKQKQNLESKTDALTRLFAKIRTQGGVPNMIIMNPEDFADVMNELKKQQTYWQKTDGAEKGTKNDVTVGLEDIKWSFASSWIEKTIDDPYCPKGTAYILDSDDLKFIGLTKTGVLDEGTVASENPGTPEVASAPAIPEQYNFKFNDFFTISPTDSEEGEGILVAEQIFGNFVLLNPAHCGVCKFK